MNHKIEQSILSLTDKRTELSREQRAELNFSANNVRNPFERIPNVEQFDLEVNQLDPLLERMGVCKKLTPDIRIKRLSSRLHASNRYLNIMFMRLVRLLEAGRSYDFWILSLMLMRKSNVLRVSALRKLDRNWHRRWKLSIVKAMMKHLDRLILEQATVFRIAREYVDKLAPDGTLTYRPIGAPSYSARMLLYLLSCFVSIYVSGYIGKYQHAYRKGMGTLTAWKDLVPKLRRNPFVYEFDLKQFFPSLNVSFLTQKLETLGIPNLLARYFYNLSMNYPAVETLDTSKLNEDNALHRAELAEVAKIVENCDRTGHPFELPSFCVDSSGNYCGVVLKPHLAFMAEKGKAELLYILEGNLGYPAEVIEANLYVCLYEYYQMCGNSLSAWIPRAWDNNSNPWWQILAESNKPIPENIPQIEELILPEFKGFPQGGALSPIFSIIGFEYALWRNWLVKAAAQFDVHIEIVAYADDFILFISGLPERIEAFISHLLECKSNFMESMGIKLHLKKSGWIKRDNVYVVEKFKFLGTTLYPNSGVVIGTPRSGKDTLYDAQNAVALFAQRHQEIDKISKVLNWNVPAQQILDGWGLGLSPYRILPASLIEEGLSLSDEQLQILKRVNLEEEATTLYQPTDWLLEKQEPEYGLPKAWQVGQALGFEMADENSRVEDFLNLQELPQDLPIGINDRELYPPVLHQAPPSDSFNEWSEIQPSDLITEMDQELIQSPDLSFDIEAGVNLAPFEDLSQQAVPPIIGLNPVDQEAQAVSEEILEDVNNYSKAHSRKFRGNSFQWLFTSLAGFIQSRLYGGHGTVSSKELLEQLDILERNLDSHPQAQNNAWIDIAKRTAANPEALDLYNSTSYASLHLLNSLRKPKLMKVRQRKFRNVSAFKSDKFR